MIKHNQRKVIKRDHTLGSGPVAEWLETQTTDAEFKKVASFLQQYAELMHSIKPLQNVGLINIVWRDAKQRAQKTYLREDVKSRLFWMIKAKTMQTLKWKV